MAMKKSAKQALKTDLAGRFQKANAAIVAEYRGLKVSELTDLRVKLREAKAEFKIIKNRIAKVSIKEDAPDCEPLSKSLKGPIGIVFCYGDAAQAAKSLLDFGKDKEIFKVTFGVMDGKGVSVADLKAIASLPSREVLLGQIVGSLVAPHRGILGVLTGVPRQLVQVINAIKDTKKA
jgi:large subunit ribosomal protein L10